MVASVTTAMNLLYEKEYSDKIRNYSVFKEDAAPETLFGRVGLRWYRLE
jgi:hypothetical protein